ncbi:MAG: 4-(cytidine 5'-diphospho)-2-C-methyl-D-erythritol kinase [Amylibacter sp.]
MTTKQIARAKINLCLHVVGQRGDGYHLLDSIVGFAEFGDVLTFDLADSTTLTIDGPFADGLSGGDDNLILQAARCFSGRKGARIHLEKNLPVASGIGGGSADAAATLRGLSALWAEPIPDVEMQLKLGADVPVCVQGGTVRMRGIGEVISPLFGINPLPLVLVNPNVTVSTPVIFNALGSKENPPIKEQSIDGWSWISDQRNDLQAPAITTEPVIALVLDKIDHTGSMLALMSGSGATCFGVYQTDKAAADAAREISKSHPEWWVQTTRLTT